jgi:CysZ protein
MVVRAALAAWRQVLSPPLRRILWRSILLTIALLSLVWLAITRLLSPYIRDNPLTADYPVVEGFAAFLSGALLFVALAYILPAVTALVVGFFSDDIAALVERSDFPGEPPGRELPTGQAMWVGLRFAALALVVNLAALALFFIPVVNLFAFFGANAYLLGREYFELAAARFRPLREASEMRIAHRGTVLAGGAMLAGLMLVPVLNLLTPLFGVALMVHLHKRLDAARPVLRRPADPSRLPGAH